MRRPRDTSITFTCAQCGASFHPWPGEEGAAMRYCSRACYNAAQKAQRAASPTKGRPPMRRNLDVTKNCEHCHQPYHPYAGHEETHRFCSQICARGNALGRVDPAVVFGEAANEKRRRVLARWAAEGRPLRYRSPRQRAAEAKENAEADQQDQHATDTRTSARRPAIRRAVGPTPLAAPRRREQGHRGERETSLPTTVPEPDALPDALESFLTDGAQPSARAMPDSPGRPLTWPLEGEEARREWQQIGELRMVQADRILRREEASAGQPGRTIILAGQGSYLGVELGDLIVHQGRTHGAPADAREVLPPALHGVKRIVWVGVNDRMGGTMTLAALAWCRREGIQLAVLDGSGEPLMSTWPEDPHDATLRRAQWSLSGTLSGAALAREILRQKINSQYQTLEAHQGELPGAQRALEQFRVWKAWLSLPKPPPWQYDLDRLRLIEGRLAGHYFGAWQEMPLPFAKTDLPRLPSHWLAARERTSPLSPQGNGRNAVDPLNAMLNYAYACLASQCRQALVASGLDVACGFLHADKGGRDSLTWDLVELERAAVDHLILTLLGKTTLHRADFVKDKGGQVTVHPQFVRLLLATCRVPQAQIDGHARWLRDWILSREAQVLSTPTDPNATD